MPLLHNAALGLGLRRLHLKPAPIVLHPMILKFVENPETAQPDDPPSDVPVKNYFR